MSLLHVILAAEAEDAKWARRKELESLADKLLKLVLSGPELARMQFNPDGSPRPVEAERASGTGTTYRRTQQ